MNTNAVRAEDISVTKLFPTPLARIEIPDAVAMNEQLTGIILEKEASERGVHHSNEGGWQSNDDFLHWSGAPGATLIGFAKALANQVSAIAHPERGLLEAGLEWNFNAWANVNRAGHSNAPHTHPSAYWSAVYWVDDGLEDASDPADGALEFFDPRGAAPTMLAPFLRMKIENCLSAGLSYAIQPRSGTLAMFPSWLLHAVGRHSGTRPRISIAINLAP